MENDPSEWARTISVNLNGTYFSLRALYPLLQARGGRGKAVCFSGGGATSPRPYFSAYAAAKTGVVRLVETVAKECAGQLDINAVAPGAIHTAMTDEVLRLGPEIVGEADFLAAQKTKVQGAEAMQKVLRLVDYLLSPQSDGLSGKLLSAPWDKWESLEPNRAMESDIFTLRRVT
jgi:NAD(P)-dependent dehydrogenase (short-subunit alcohol dehydrogenase family)